MIVDFGFDFGNWTKKISVENVTNTITINMYVCESFHGRCFSLMCCMCPSLL